MPAVLALWDGFLKTAAILGLVPMPQIFSPFVSLSRVYAAGSGLVQGP